MKVIYKYPIEYTQDIKEINMPDLYQVIHFNAIEGKLFVWAEVEPFSDPVPQYFILYGTGWAHKDILQEYIGTVIVEGFVWHLYEITDHAYIRHWLKG